MKFETYLLIVWLLSVFAVFRVAEMIAFDDGPFSIFERIRAGLGRWASGYTKGSIPHNLAVFINCPYCIGVWLAVLPLYFFREMAPPEMILMWLAIAGGQAFLEGLCYHERG